MIERWMQRGWLIFVAMALVVLINLNPFAAVATIASATSEAAQLNQTGFILLQQGQPQAALEAFQKATKLYQQSNQHEGTVGTQINQAIAMQMLGLNLRACGVLGEVLEIEVTCLLGVTGEPSVEQLRVQLQSRRYAEVEIIGLRWFGSVLRQLGRLSEAEIALQAAQQAALGLADSPESVRVALELGATYQLFWHQVREQYDLSTDLLTQERILQQIEQYIVEALEQYDRAMAQSETITARQAQLNRLKLAVDFAGWLSDHRSAQSLDPLLSQIIERVGLDTAQPLSSAFYAVFSPIEAIYNQVGFVQSLLSQPALDLSALGLSDSLPQLLKLIDNATAQARSINSPRALSFALGVQAEVLERLGDSPRLVEATYLEALANAQASHAWDSAYQWQRDLGKLYLQQGQIDRSIAAYRSAIDNLNQVRDELSGVTPDLLFSFTNRIEPIYKEYMQALLTPAQPDLTEVVQVNESLQTAELENFLRCGRLDLVRLEQLSQIERPVVIHIIELKQTVSVIVQAPDRSFHQYSIPADSVNATARSLLLNLQSPSALEVDSFIFVNYGQQLYRWLLEPAQSDGLIPDEATLVFVLDRKLQNVPMALLHDGSQFLIETHRIALALGSLIRQPQPLPSEQLQGLVAGVSKATPGFEDERIFQSLQPLPFAEVELRNIEQYLDNSVVLLNEAFTAERFLGEIASGDFPIVHVITHGQFSSDPERTVLIAWDKLISAAQVDQLLRTSSETGRSTLELLVLSACQTAKGDQRSVLGIAGISAQAGARSTVASLWSIDDRSTSVLMGQFYQKLRAGRSKSEALRQAQIALLHSSDFDHPYYWAAFILVGSWL